jgi:hypothetical protein
MEALRPMQDAINRMHERLRLVALTGAPVPPTVEHMSEYETAMDTAEWLWRISLRDDLLVTGLDARTDLSDFAATDAERDWHLKRLAGYGRTRDELTVERVPGPYARAIADDRERRLKLIDAYWEQRRAERARQRGETP